MQVFEVGAGKTYATITAAVNAMEAMFPKSTSHTDSVYINVYSGTYYESIDLTNTVGTSSYPVTIQAPDGEEVIIDGGLGTTLYYTQITSPVLLGATTINVADTSAFPSSGTIITNIYTVTYTGTTPTSFTGCTGANALNTVNDNYYATNNVPQYCISFLGSSYVTFKNLIITNFFRDGIVGYNPTPGVQYCTIDGCTFDETSPFGRSCTLNGTGNVIKNCHVDIGTIAYVFQLGSDLSALVMDNNVVISNAVTKHLGVSTFCGSEIGPGSTVKNCTFVNYVLQKSGDNCTFDSNLLVMGAMTQSFSAANNHIIKNNIFINTAGPILYWQMAAGGDSIGLRGTGSVVYNNTIYDAYNAYSIYVNGASNIIKNNIIVNNKANGYAIYGLATQTYTSDYNCFYGAPTLKWRYGGVDQTVFATYQSASGQDANSFLSDPLFVGTGTHYYDFQLSSSSPCIEGGVDLTSAGITRDYGGFARTTPFDIGAITDVISIPSIFVIRRHNYNIVKWELPSGITRPYYYTVSRTSNTNGYDYVDIANITTFDSAGNVDTIYIDIDVEDSVLYFYKIKATISPYDTGVFSNEETGIYFADIQDNHPELAESLAGRWDLSNWDDSLYS